MPNYARAFRPGGTFFLTLVTEGRAPLFADERARAILHEALERCRRHHPFVLEASVCLPDHLHMLMRLPEGDADYSIRIANLKSAFTHAWLAAAASGSSASGNIPSATTTICYGTSITFITIR